MIWLIGWLACMVIGVAIVLMAYSGKIYIPDRMIVVDSLLEAWGVWFAHIAIGALLAIIGLIGLIGWMIAQ